MFHGAALSPLMVNKCFQPISPAGDVARPHLGNLALSTAGQAYVARAHDRNVGSLGGIGRDISGTGDGYIGGARSQCLGVDVA